MRRPGALLALLALAGCDLFTATPDNRMSSSGTVERQYECRDEKAPLPRLAGRVVDEARLLPADRERALTGRLAALEDRTRHQLVVVTIASLHGQPVEDYTLRLANCWGIGRASHNDGVVLLIVPAERKLRIEIGEGLEKTFSNEEAARIVADTVERIRTGDMVGGIEQAVAGIEGEIGGGVRR